MSVRQARQPLMEAVYSKSEDEKRLDDLFPMEEREEFFLVFDRHIWPHFWMSGFSGIYDSAPTRPGLHSHGVRLHSSDRAARQHSTGFRVARH